MRLPGLSTHYRSVMAALFVVCIFPLVVLPQASQQEPAHVEPVPLILHPYGFEPSEVTLPPGPTLFQVYNRVGFEELALRLDREVEVQGRPGPPDRLTVKQETVNRTTRKWREQQTLEAGTYILSVDGHPKWVCKITVSATR